MRPERLAILDNGNCEPLKAVVHGAALGLAALMATYNAAAWLRRRQSHLALNTFIYVAAVVWEQRRVADHLLPCAPASPAFETQGPDEPIGDQSKAA
jgi:hypothetical protein